MGCFIYHITDARATPQPQLRAFAMMDHLAAKGRSNFNTIQVTRAAFVVFLVRGT